MRRGSIFSSFFIIYQAILIFIIGLIVVSCIGQAIFTGSDPYLGFLAMRDPISSTCSGEGQSQAQGFQMTTGYFIMQLHASTGSSCWNILNSLDEGGKFREGGQCSNENCDGYCLCMAQSTATRIGSVPIFPVQGAVTEDFSASASPLLDIQTASEDGCTFLDSLNSIRYLPNGSVCCIPVTCGPMLDNYENFLQGIYSSSSNIEFRSLGFKKEQTTRFTFGNYDALKIYIVSE